MKTKPKTYTGADALAMRRKLKLNQSQFWNRVATTQSGGSRYESGRDIPLPVQRLLQVAYGTERQSADLVNDLRGGAQ